MKGKELTKRVSHVLYATALFFVVLFSSPASAETGSSAEDALCKVTDIRTDVRPDLFIVGSTILVFLALIETAVTVYLVSNEKKEYVLRIDRACRFLFPLAFLAIIAALFMG